MHRMICLLLISSLATTSLAQITRPAKSWRLTPITELRASAEAGIADAQLELADRLDTGRGMKKDPVEALQWLRKSATIGSVEAQLRLASRLMSNPSDQPEAVTLYQRAAEKGDSRAQYELAVCYKSGKGTGADDAEALKWFTKSADQNNPNAALAAGDAHHDGRGTQKDFAQALKYYRRAADQGNPDAAAHIARMYRDGEGVRTDAREMLAWYNKAVQRGSVEGAWELAQMYREGKLVPRNTQLAIPLLKKLAVQHHPQAQEALAQLDPKAIAQLAKPLVFKGEDPDPAQINMLVRADGRISVAKAKQWTIAIKSGAREITLPVDPPADPGKAKDGMTVSLYGTLTESKSIHCLLVTAAAPTFDVSYDLKKPNTIVAGHSQKYSCEGTLKNTSKQPIKKVKLRVHFYQPGSPNDETKDVTVENIGAGQQKKFDATVSWHNYQYAGGTSEPKVEVEIAEYEW